MRCLYCGKEVALFKRLRGGEFCSEAHRQRYQEEYTQLALNRLLQANPPTEQESGGANPKEIKAAEPDSPALLRRESLGREDALATLSATLEHAAASKNGTSKPAAAPMPTLVAKRLVVEEPPQAGMSSFLVESPVAAVFETPAMVDLSTHVTPTPGLELPHLQEFPRETTERHLGPAGRLPLNWFTPTDFPTPLQERGLELREFARGVPPVEIRVRPASKAGFEPTREAMEARLDAHPPEDSPRLWQASEEQLPALGRTAEILLGELARLDFAVTGWENLSSEEEARTEPARPSQPLGTHESSTEHALLKAHSDVGASSSEVAGPDSASVEQPPPANQHPEVITRLEPMRVAPIQSEPASLESSRPQPLHFEPVHIDPVFMEQVAGTAEFHAQKTALGRLGLSNDRDPGEPPPSELTAGQLRPGELRPNKDPLLGRDPRENKATAREELAAEAEASGTVEAGAPVSSIEAAPAEAAPTPTTITKPVPVTLHGLAPSRGKPVQVFPSAVSRSGDIQVPRETGLPLRPTMVWGPAPKPADVPSRAASVPDEKAPAGKPAKSIPIPEKRAARAIEVKPRRSEIRVLPVQLPKEPTGKPEPAVASKKDAPVERPNPAPPVRAAEPVPAKAKAPIAPPPVEPDLLGLPKLSFQSSENFWTRLPMAARFGAIAAALALLVGGVILTSRGSGAPKNTAPPDSEPQMVEAGAPLANTAGWMQDWFADRPDSRLLGRHVDILRGSLTLRDYRLVFEGQIEQGALGWVFRAYDKSFYVEKIQVITPGRDPVVALVRFAVIDGWEQKRTQIPLPIQAHLDTTYKVRMDVVGNRFTTWVQDQKVDQWTDNQIAAGGVGLYYDSGDSAKLRDTLNVIPLKPK